MTYNSYRLRCPKCGEVMDARGDVVCKCGTPLTVQSPGMIRIYRMGSPIGIAGGFGIYINGIPVGYIGNKQTVNIPVPYGTYTIHIAVGMNRGCNDPVVNITPESPVYCGKVHMRMGFWTNSFVIEEATPESMPD